MATHTMSSSNNNTSVPSTQPHPVLDNQTFTDTEIMPEPTTLHPQQQQSTTGMPTAVPYATEPAPISKSATPSDPIPFTPPSTLVESTPLPGEMRIAQTALEPAAVLTPAPGIVPKAGQEGGVPLSQRKPSTQMNMTLTPAAAAAAAATAATAATRLTGSRLSGVSVQDEDPEAIFRLDQHYHAVPAPSQTSPGLSKGKGSISSNKQRQLNKQQQQQQQQQLQLRQPQPQPQQDQQASQAMDLTYSSSSENPQYQHLPTLWQILNRKTLPPVCLFNFYLYMRDCEQSAEEVDFWLDVTAHELLWKLYVRATRRRAALLAAERAERAEKEEEAAAARLEAEKWKSQVDEDQEQAELIKGEKGHQTKPSITLDMYEPHWSAANRYLEISGNDRSGGAAIFNDNKSNISDYDEAVASPMLTTTATGSNPSTTHYPNLNNNINRSNPNQSDQNNTHFKESSAPLLLNTALPLSPISPTSTLGHANSLVGPLSPVVVDISTLTDVWPRTADPTEATAGRQDKGTVGNKAAAAGASNGVDIQQQSGPTGAKSLNSGSTPRRALSAVAAGVTREDLQRSAERIYCKYLTPQAEKPVRVPGSVRHRVAFVMDILMTSGSGVVAANGNGVGDTAAVMGGARGAGLQGLRSPSMVSLKRKSNAGTTKSSLSLIANEKAANGSGRRPSATDSHRPKTNQTSGSGSSVSQPDHELGLVFAEAREIVFEGMETFYFPRFLKARAYGNMVHSHRVLRAVIGLFLLFLGFVAVLCLIFLNVRSRSVRAWALIPVSLGTFLCTTFQFNICPIMVLFQVSETKLFQYAKIKEPYIMKLHRQRAVKVAVVAVVYTICIATIFGVIPGHRL